MPSPRPKEKLIDYYALYGLQRGEDRKTLLKQLRDKQKIIKNRESSGALNDEETMNELMEQDRKIADAIKVFKTDERLAEYNRKLDAARKAGLFDEHEQARMEKMLSDLESLFDAQKFDQVIYKCKKEIEDNAAGEQVYYLLAQSYFMNGDGQAAVNSANEFIRIYPDNPDALNLEVRYQILVNDDNNKAQEYLNTILETYKDSALGVLDQIYIHIAERNLDMAFSEIDSYIADNPNNQNFRRSVAYDLIGFASRMYKVSFYGDTEIAYLMSDNDYQFCRKLTDKAVAVYRDQQTVAYANYTVHMGETVFNMDNRSYLRYTIYAAIIYLFGAFMNFGSHENTAGAILAVLGAACVFLLVEIILVSRRPYWQIYKYDITGEREPKEKVVLRIASIFSFYIKACVMIAKWILRVVFHMTIRAAS